MKDLLQLIGCDYALQFCSYRWIENERVPASARNVWEKYLQIIAFWKGLVKSKQPGQGKPGANKSFDSLLSNDALVPLKLRFFEEIVNRLNSFLATFQTDAPMVPIIVDRLEEILRSYCSKFILPDTLEKASTTLKLMQLNFLDKNIYRPEKLILTMASMKN